MFWVWCYDTTQGEKCVKITVQPKSSNGRPSLVWPLILFDLFNPMIENIYLTQWLKIKTNVCNAKENERNTSMYNKPQSQPNPSCLSDFHHTFHSEMHQSKPP